MIACVVPDSGWYLIGQPTAFGVLKTLCRISLEPDSCVSQTQTPLRAVGNQFLGDRQIRTGPRHHRPAARRRAAHRLAEIHHALAPWARCFGRAAGLAAGALFKSQIDALLDRLDRIGGIAGLIVAGLLAAYIAFKWWERARFYRTLRMARIHVEDLYELMQAGATPIIVDVRSATARALEPRWIPGAMHVPLQDVGRHIEDLPRDRDIILYCACPSEASAARVAKLLMNHGFKKVRPLYGGLDAWIAAGYARRTRRAGEPSRERHGPHHVVIVGAGFGGMAVAQRLGRRRVRITMVDQRNHHLFQPLLYQVGTATLATSEIAWPIRQLLRKRKEVTTLLAAVTGIDVANRNVLLDDGGTLDYDTLVLATGARHAYFGHDEWEPYAPGLKTLEDAISIRRRDSAGLRARRARDRSRRRRSALLTFVIVGGGATGVELAGAIAELAHVTLPDEFRHIDTRKARVVLIEAGPRILPSFATGTLRLRACGARDDSAWKFDSARP